LGNLKLALDISIIVTAEMLQEPVQYSDRGGYL
jgi:hypothetical protein